MAKVTVGPLASSIRGKVGDVIFQFINGVQSVRAMPGQIADPQTPKQLEQRAAFAQAVNEWNELTIPEQEKWNAWANIQGDKTGHAAEMRTDGGVGRKHGQLFDGHNAVVALKSFERSVTPMPGEIGLPENPPWRKTRSLPPYPLEVIAVKGQESPATPDGLYFTWLDRVTEVIPGVGRVWVAPPRPVHKQLITIQNDFWIPALENIGATEMDGCAFTPSMRVSDSEVDIFVEDVETWQTSPEAVGVWRVQLDEMDVLHLPSFLSEIFKFRLIQFLDDGYWLLYPTEEELPGPP